MLNPVAWGRALLVAATAVLLALLFACYRVTEPRTPDCVVEQVKRIGVPSVTNPADTLWVNVVIRVHVPCDSLGRKAP